MDTSDFIFKKWKNETLSFYFQLGHNNYVNVAITSQHRLSGQSYESGVSGVSVTSSRQSYHSNSSSSSLGSLDRLEESGYSSTVNVHELFQAGLSVSTHSLFRVVSCTSAIGYQWAQLIATLNSEILQINNRTLIVSNLCGHKYQLQTEKLLQS